MNNLLSSCLYNNETFYGEFVRDLQNAKHIVIVESPFITSKRMSKLLPILCKLRREGVRVIVNTRNPEEHDSEYASQAIHPIAAMQGIGVVVLYTVRHHRKLAIIGHEVLWEGGLNILSQYDSCEVMRRSKSTSLAQQMTEFIGLGEYL